MGKKYLPFFWDYQLTSSQLKRFLSGGEGEAVQIWAATRLLESASYKEVWKYISLKQLKKIFPKLKLKTEVKRAWRRVFKAWEV